MSQPKDACMPPVSLEDVERLKGLKLDSSTISYDARDVAHYALAIGAPSDPMDPDELKFVYERSAIGFQVIPTFAATFDRASLHTIISGELGGLQYEPMMLVHGEHEMEFFRAFPVQATVKTSAKIIDVFDKGSGLLIYFEANSCDESGSALARARYGIFIRGLGGFGGERGPSVKVILPERSPDFAYNDRTLKTQALLYRLGRDENPLHVDPQQAAKGGFARPILHGMCTFGFAARALIKHGCGNEAGRLASIAARFSRHVFPGETLRTEIWKTDQTHMLFRTIAVERDELVLTQGRASIRD